MNRENGKMLLAGRLAHYRGYRYEQLTELIGSCQVEELSGSDGALFQLEFGFYGDDKLAGNVRVIGSIDGGGVSALTPLTDGVIMATDGTFVGD